MTSGVIFMSGNELPIALVMCWQLYMLVGRELPCRQASLVLKVKSTASPHVLTGSVLIENLLDLVDHDLTLWC